MFSSKLHSAPLTFVLVFVNQISYTWCLMQGSLLDEPMVDKL